MSTPSGVHPPRHHDPAPVVVSAARTARSSRPTAPRPRRQEHHIPTAARSLPSDPSLVLATDLDGTFLGGSDEDRAALYERLIRHRDEVVLLFVTGRDLDFIADLVRQPGMPQPDLIIGDVGTTIVQGHDHAPLDDVQRWIDERWDDATDRVLAMLHGAPGLELQPVMGSRRVSYYYDPAELQDATVASIEAAGFDVVRSADLYLDVLPRGVAKGPTLTRLVDALGLPDDRVLVAGDTLNDLSLFQTRFRGVAVGNAEAPLVDAIDGLPAVHHSAHPGCAGIADAIEHFGLTPSTSPSTTFPTERPATR